MTLQVSHYLRRCSVDAKSPYCDIKSRRSLAQQDYFDLGQSLSFLRASSLLKLRVPTRKVRAIPVLKERRKSLTPVIAAPPPRPHPSTPDPFSSTSDGAHWGNDLPGARRTARPARGHFIYLPPFLSLSNGLAARSFARPFRQKNILRSPRTTTATTHDCRSVRHPFFGMI